MKRVFPLFMVVVLSSCNQSSSNEQVLKQQVDSLQAQIKNAYKPGLGEFMLGMQMHHAKLWFAGKEKNWKLANFELEEMEETVGDIRQYCTDRPEVKSLGMIDAPLDSLKQSLQNENSTAFVQNFTLLTNTCNNCHVATLHGFNVIKIPDVPPVSNQDFGAKSN